MRTFAIAALAAAVTSARRAHEFNAENHFICEVCKDAVNFKAQYDVDGLANLYQQFPKLQERFHFYGESSPEIFNSASPEESCVAMELCSDNHVLDLLQEEKPLNLFYHMEVYPVI